MTLGSTRRQFLEMTGAAAGMAGLETVHGGQFTAAGNEVSARRQRPGSTPSRRPGERSITTCRTPIISSAGSSTDSSFMTAMACTFLPSRSPVCLSNRRLRRPTWAGPKARTTWNSTEPDHRRRTDAGNRQAGCGRRAIDRRARQLSLSTRSCKNSIRGDGSSATCLTFSAASGQSVPVFIDKHLSYSRPEAREMIDQAAALNVPLMAGSSLPVTWRLPELEIPLGRKFKEVVVASRGDLEIFGFHALETLQCMAERRDLGGKPQGVVAVTYLEKDAVWEAGDKGVWSWKLLEEALGRSHTVNPGDIKQNTRDYHAAARRRTRSPDQAEPPHRLRDRIRRWLARPSLILNGHVDDTTIAARISDSAGGETDRLDLDVPARASGCQLLQPLGFAHRRAFP